MRLELARAAARRVYSSRTAQESRRLWLKGFKVSSGLELGLSDALTKEYKDLIRNTSLDAVEDDYGKK